MSKRERINNLAVFIGLRAAHEILLSITNKPESAKHLDHEADTYSNLSFELAQGNWSISDIEKIKELAKKRCKNKLHKYEEIEEGKFKAIDNVIKNILMDLGLE